MIKDLSYAKKYISDRCNFDYILVYVCTTISSCDTANMHADVQQRHADMCVACGCGENISSHANEAGFPHQSLFLLNSVIKRQKTCPAD